MNQRSESHSTQLEPTIDRRTLLQGGAIASAALAGLNARVEALASDVQPPALEGADPFKVEHVQRTTVRLPYREVPERNMARELPHWTYSEIVEVRLASGRLGFGETLLFYTWGATGDDDVARAQGANAIHLLWDDSLGSGLQMALFDAVAKTLGVPVHALLGRKLRDQAPLSWWAIDMPPADWLAECQEALRQGYLAFKTKGRPWFDIREQVSLLARELPAEFKIDMDFNDTLLDADRAIPILQELEAYPQVGIYETPIPQADVPGNKAIRAATKIPIAMHYGSPKPIVALREQVCDGFVASGGARKLLEQGMVSAMAGLPLWLQQVGTDITAAYSLHFGAVLEAATWPAVNCHQLYAHPLLTRPITVTGGLAQIPDAPGLGFELDQDAIRRFRVDKPPARPEPRRLIEVRESDGTCHYVASPGQVNFMITQANRGNLPYYPRGVMTRLVPDDGSPRWRDLYDRAQEKPVVERL